VIGEALRDLRLAVRRIAARPGFSLLVVATLGLGIGAGTAVFSLVDTLLLSPLPFPDSGRLVRLRDAVVRPGQRPWLYNTCPRSYFAMKEQVDAFASITAQEYHEFNLTGIGEPRRIVGIGVSGDWIRTLGAVPVLGRGFSPEEHAQGRESRVVLIGYGMWQRLFGSDPGVLQRRIILEGESYRVIGVMPRFINYPYGAQVWMPQHFDRDSGAFGPNVNARLRPGVSLEEAQAELDVLSARLRNTYPDTHGAIRLTAVSLRNDLVGNQPRIGWLLLVATGFLLLLTCVNLAGLFLVQSAGRTREFAIRAALGSGRRRQVVQVLVESLVLGTLGGLLGIGLGLLAMDGVRAFSLPADSSLGPFFQHLVLDRRVLAFAAGLTLLTSMAFGVGPALAAARPDLHGLLKESARSGRRRNRRVLSALTVLEVALSVVLLAGTALLVQNLRRLEAQDPGYDPGNRLVAKLNLSEGAYADPEARSRYLDRVLARLAAVPGVRAAGVTQHLPLQDGSSTRTLSVENGPVSTGDVRLLANFRTVSAGYFRAMGIPLLAGRGFDPRGEPEGTTPVVVSRGFAGRYWPGRDPLGRRIKFGPEDADIPWFTVIGMVGDVDARYEIRETVYLPYERAPATALNLVVATGGILPEHPRLLREAVWEIDPDQPVQDITPMARLVSESRSQQRLASVVLGFFSAFGVLLAFLGIFGVVSFSVQERTHELGIRMALGAPPSGVIRSVLAEGAVRAGAGLVLGLALALPAIRAMGDHFSGASRWVPVDVRLLSGARSLDPAIYLVILALLFATFLLACYVPGRRAAAIDPMVALGRE